MTRQIPNVFKTFRYLTFERNVPEINIDLFDRFKEASREISVIM